jgi:hypothetical protein
MSEKTHYYKRCDCGFYYKYGEKEKHENSPEHIENYEEGNKKPKYFLKCPLCDYSFYLPQHEHLHIMSRCHLRKLKNEKFKKKQYIKKSKKNENKIIESVPVNFNIFIC